MADRSGYLSSYSFLDSFLNKLNSKLPITAPHSTLRVGEAVIGHVPLSQPIKYQYKYPVIPPAIAPAKYVQLRLNIDIILSITHSIK